MASFTAEWKKMWDSRDKRRAEKEWVEIRKKLDKETSRRTEMQVAHARMVMEQVEKQLLAKKLVEEIGWDRGNIVTSMGVARGHQRQNKI